jgi:dephospho-CoA kinase
MLDRKRSEYTIVILGITGKIASGKSTVCGYIKNIKENALVLDIDGLAKDIYSKRTDVVDRLRELFGTEVFGCAGDLDFESMASKVFSNNKELEKLNRLMFPLIRDEVKNIIDKNSDKDYIIIDAAVLFDCKLDLLCDYIILVDTSYENRRTFLKNKNFSKADIELRIKGQHIKIDMEKVDFVINNDGPKDSLLEKVKGVLKNI